MATFGTELVQAARAYIGAPAILHYKLAGNCLVEPGNCHAVGLGPDSFDCSGLVIRAMCDVLGTRVDTWPQDLRHVRDLWSAAQQGQHGLQPSPSMIGSLLVAERHHVIGGEILRIPGHVGVVSRLRDDGVDLIHTNAFSGVVEESPPTTSRAILGAFSLQR